jgi:hypothetical protein
MFREKMFIGSLIMAFIAFSVVFSTSIELFAFDYVIDNFNFYPTPWNMPKPAKGVPFKDSVFHTEIVRITDAPADIVGGKSVDCGYPKHDIENADGTKLIIQGVGGSTWHIWNANPPYNRIKEIPVSLIGWGSQIDARWDTNDPEIIYYTYSNKLTKYNVNTDAYKVLHDFSLDNLVPPEAGKFMGVSMQEEGTPSDDSRYWCYIVTAYLPAKDWYPYGVVVYDKDFFGKDNGKIISKIDLNNPNFRVPGFTSMSPSGKYAWIGDTPYIYPRDLSSVLRINLVGGHTDLDYSREGREILFGVQNYGNTAWYAMGDIETGVITRLHEWNWGQYHISGNCLLTPGWGVVSVYQPRYATETNSRDERAWGDFEIFMVELTTRTDPPPRIWRIAKTHTEYRGYGGCPFAKINRKGTKIWFGSYWGTANKDVFQINLPSTWYKDLMGNMPPTASISATPLSGKPPLTVNFTGSGKDVDGTIASYSWNFGDGSTSTQQNASHTYETPGSYTATFKVTDDKGAGGFANVTVNVLKSDTTPPAPPTGLKIVK